MTSHLFFPSTTGADAISAEQAIEVAPHGNVSGLTRARAAMGLRDLVMFCVVTGISVRWIGTAAAAGPSSITIWIGAFLLFYLPLLAAVLELSSRFDDGDGGIYHWSQRALGDWAGFMTGWTYWTSNLPYYPSILLFAAGAAAYLISDQATVLAADPVYVVAFSVVAMWLATLVNIVGLSVGKWLHNFGAIGNWGPILVFLVLAPFAWARYGSATTWTWSAFVPQANLREMVFWTSLVFALTGSEASAFLRSEVRGFRRQFPRALIIGGAFVVTGYIFGAGAILVILPAEQVSSLGGIMQTAVAGTQRIGWTWLVPIMAALLVVANVGAVGAWLTASARLPFLAGIDRYLPERFGRIHPRWGTPHVSFVWQAIFATAFILVAQSGSTVAGAYQILISMSLISYFMPYLFTFASVLRMQRIPPGPDVIRPPGGCLTATVLASVGFTITLTSMLLACVPDAAEPDKPLAVIKVVGSMLLLVGVGQLVYLRGQRQRQVA
ncbi:MAG TPA: APC family permease [Rudaea sp.]|jgi:amino acid transporter